MFSFLCRVYTDWSHIQGLSQWRLAAVGYHLVRSAGDFAGDHAYQHQGLLRVQGELGMLKIPYKKSRSWRWGEKGRAQIMHIAFIAIFTLRQMTHVANGLSSLHLYGRTCLNILIYIYTYIDDHATIQYLVCMIVCNTIYTYINIYIYIYILIKLYCRYVYIYIYIYMYIYICIYICI